MSNSSISVSGLHLQRMLFVGLVGFGVACHGESSDKPHRPDDDTGGSRDIEDSATQIDADTGSQTETDDNSDMDCSDFGAEGSCETLFTMTAHPDDELYTNWSADEIQVISDGCDMYDEDIIATTIAFTTLTDDFVTFTLQYESATDSGSFNCSWDWDACDTTVDQCPYACNQEINYEMVYEEDGIAFGAILDTYGTMPFFLTPSPEDTLVVVQNLYLGCIDVEAE